MQNLSRKDFADMAEEYIRKLNEIAEKHGFNVLTAFYIEGTDKEPSDYSIDWRNMTMDDTLYALARWTQEIMNSYDDEEGIETQFPSEGFK